MQRMLKMSRIYTLAEILSKIFVKKTKENWGPYLRSWFEKLTIWYQLKFCWFKLYFICIIYDKYTNNTEYDYNKTTIQMGFRRKSYDLFESVSQEFTLLVYVLSCRNCHLYRE